MARAVVLLAGDASLRARLAAGALELVRENFSHDAVIPRIRAFLSAAAADAAAERNAVGPGARVTPASQVTR
jgi:hypothetical protein